MDFSELMHTRSGRSLIAFFLILPVAAFFLLRAVILAKIDKKKRSRLPDRNPPVDFGTPAEEMARRAEAAFLARVRKRLPNARAFHYGAVDLDPKHLAVWIMTATDREKQEVLEDPQTEIDFRAALTEVGYPAQAIPLAHFTAESEETVNRDHGGDWWHATR